MSGHVVTLGYLVTIDRCVAYESARGVLYLGRPYGTVFRSQRDAQRAINRTLDYSVANRIDWRPESYSIKTMRRAPARAKRATPKRKTDAILRGPAPRLGDREMTARRPCTECPWRVDTPPGQFSPERYAELRRTTGSPGHDRPFGSPMFACHKAPLGQEFACAGWLAAVGYYHITVRVLVTRGDIPPEALKPGEDWPALYPSYDALLRIHGTMARRASGTGA